MPPALLKFLGYAWPLLAGLMGAYGVMSVERDRNAQTRADVEAMKAAAPTEAAWHQHVDDRLDTQAAALERIERAVGSK